MGEIGVDLERDPAVARLIPAIEYLAQQVAGIANVVARQREEDLARVGFALQDLPELVVVGVAVGDRALEDGRVRGHADDALVDQRTQLSLTDKGAGDVIDPRALAKLRE